MTTPDIAVTAQHSAIETTVDNVIAKYRTTEIQYYPYVSGAVDTYRQKVKAFGTPVTIIGRAILNPTREILSVVGNNETYEIAFLFSRLEMNRRFPAAIEGEWIDVSGELTWFNRRYKIEQVHQTGQVGANFSLVVALGNSKDGARDG